MKRFEDKATFKLTWLPYMIDTGTKKGGEDYLSYNRRRWGGDSWTEELKDSSKKDGCKFANWKIWPNTLHAHRLAQYAAKYDKQDQVEDLLFQYCYEKGENISSISTLIKCAEEAKLSEAKKFLESEELLNEVIELDSASKKQGVDGVPYCLIQGKYALSGAQAPQTFVRYFEKCLEAAAD
eukprot:TRINITY_DN11744_c0_g1_i1.p1 TRINITY_DN11744_c0_g1~~TRINITY_DN11744_c0_g1_i1.p1  ORF type:complete len:181 (-),score=21.47 TRINITY_DN11744_c0_g1_i1:203-745(-)